MTVSKAPRPPVYEKQNPRYDNIMNKTTTLPAGTYYVGDLCYVAHDDDWMDFCDRMFPDDQPVGGVKEMPDGTNYADFCTKYGDGVYYDGFLGEYYVDSGSIGCIPVCALREGFNLEDAMRLGQIVNFKKAFEVGYDDETGTITFGEISIVTGDIDDEKDDYEEDEE